MKKIAVAVAAGVVLFTLSSCGRTKDLEDDKANIAGGTPGVTDTAGGGTQKDNITGSGDTNLPDDALENLTGEYDYASEGGTGKLIIKKTSDGYDISDYESESSYRFLADSSNIESIEKNRIYIKYPEQVFSDDTVLFRYYILEYGADEINVYCGESLQEEAEFLYCATKKVEKEDSSRQSLSERIATEISSAEEREKEIEKKQREADTQMDMNLTAAELYQHWDDTLNIVWGLLEENLNETDMEVLREEEKEWITFRDEEVRAVGEECGGGSIQPSLEASMAAELTKARVYELAEYAEGREEKGQIK